MPPCLIGMEACVGAHHLSRKTDAGEICARVFQRAEKRFSRRGGDCRGRAALDDEIVELQVIEGRTLHENKAMLKMCQEFGFEPLMDPDDPRVTVTRFSVI
jgi:hypothetical protein